MTNIFHTLLKPQSIAVIGASRSPQKVGYQLLKNIIDDGYSGKIYPVNPSASKILGLKAYPTLTSIGEKIDLPIIVTPAGVVYPILNECQSLGSKAAIVITAGFSESGSQGQLLQQKIQQLTKSQQFRILGPNCLGVLSPVYHLNATFGPPLPKKGNVCLISQSGALVTGVLDWVKKQGLGLSQAISLVIRLDIKETDDLEVAFQDTHTKVIMMYLESFASATDFFSLCSRVSPHKPILLLKGGQSAAGVAASASHTAALATNFTLVSALARQTGVILSDTIQSWLTSAVIMADSKSFYSDRMAIITNAGGPGVLATDEAIAHHLRVVPFSRTTTEKLARKLSLGVVHNPLDLLGDASPEDFLQALSLIDTDSQVDLIHLIMTPQTTTKPVATARIIIHAYPKLKKPLFISLLGGDKMTPAKRLLENIGIPVYTYPNEAITTIATKNWYLKHRRGFYYYPAQIPSYAT